MCGDFLAIWELVFLLSLRAFLLMVSVVGLFAMRRLYLRGEELEFPIVPRSLVKLTSAFLVTVFCSVTWITVTMFTSGETLCYVGDQPIGALTTLQRFAYGWSLAFSLGCTLWIIVLGSRGYRRGPRVDAKVLDAIVEGMSKNPGIEGTDGCSR